ncbi:C4-dicarboxylate ABC transporter [Vibrio mimicus]|nr:C4-dicarboxylate ABC transporter [Vibrio mimicus]
MCLSFVAMRCQPLRRTLCYESKLTQILFFAVTEQFL